MIGNDPKTIDYFKQQRPELYNYVLNDVIPENKKFKLVHAPVKSGKRGMVEVHSLLDKESSHIFLTALHRTADENQRKELESYGIKVFSINNTKKKNECIKYIDDKLALGKEIKPHLDELDFGCGDKQLLNCIYSAYKNNPHVTFILYSATIEVAKKEFLVVNNIEDFHECKSFNPPPTYFGIKKFLDEKKFFQATPFVSYNCDDESIKITTQGENLIKKLKENTNNTNNKRHIAVLRLAGNFKTNDKKSISQFDTMKKNSEKIETQYGIRLKFVGSNDNSVEWDNLKTWGDYNPAIPYIFVINQVAGRSTEWKCHPYVVWYHTMRTDDTPTSTIIQDQERPVYYISNYTDDIDIEIYGDVPSAQYSAGIITLEQYDAMSNRKINARLNTKNQKKHIKVKPPKCYDSWAEIPAEYRKDRTLSSHVKPEYKLKEFMTTNNNKSYQIKNWDKYSHLEGFYMTNIRSSISEFIKGTSKKINLNPIWFKSDLLDELKEGIDEKTKIRINLFYEDNETNANNYKFMIREYESSEVAGVDNTSMYNK